MYGCNQACELIDSDAVFLEITPYNTRDQARINFPGCAFLAHIPNQAVAFYSIWMRPICFQFDGRKYFRKSGVYMHTKIQEIVLIYRIFEQTGITSRTGSASAVGFRRAIPRIWG